MAGRGRGMTLPAWMTKGGENGGPGEYPDSSSSGLLSKGDNAESGGRFDDASQLKGSQDSSSATREDKENKDDDGRRGRDDRGRDRSKDRSRDRARSRDRSREKERRKSRSRSRDRSRDRSSRRSRRSRSGSRTPPRRRRRASNFDVPPPGVTAESAKAADLLTQSVLQQQHHQVAAVPILPVTPTISLPSLTPYGGGMGMAAANMQQTRHARRIYVGGIIETNDYELREFFNDVVQKALEEPIEGGAVVSVYINQDRHFAFVEFKSIELTTACVQQLDGITFKGQPVKIRRPTDYQPHMVPPSNLPIPRLNLSRLGIIGTTVPDGPNKIFIGGLPYNLSNEQIKELLQAFGTLKAFHLVTDSATGQSKGYAFCEYEDPAIGPIACQNLNEMRLGDKTLTVRIAMSATEAKSAQAAAGSVNSALGMGGINPIMGGVPGLAAMSGLGAQAALSFAGGLGGLGGMGMAAAVPTRVLVLENMVTEEELRDDNEYEDIVDDVRGEVSKYGTVKSLVIPRPPGNSSVGKIFIEYEAATMAQAAANALRGRQFGGRAVVTTFYDEGKFAAKDLV